jgi:hypothetical protein
MIIDGVAPNAAGFANSPSVNRENPSSVDTKLRASAA